MYISANLGIASAEMHIDVQTIQNNITRLRKCYSPVVQLQRIVLALPKQNSLASLQVEALNVNMTIHSRTICRVD